MFRVKLSRCWDNGIPSVSTSLEENEKCLDMLKEMQEDIKALVQATREMAIEDGYAEMVTGKQPELSPTRALFIELYGQEEFDRVKRLGKAKETFTWK